MHTRSSIAVVIPAHNEAERLGDCLAALHFQSRKPDRIIVVDDCSTDGTTEVAMRTPHVQVVWPSECTGAKSRAQNYGLQFVEEDIVLTVDADTILDPNYIWWIEWAMSDPKVAAAAGCVLPQVVETPMERGRLIEGLLGFHFFRPIQAMCGASIVLAGCCTAIRTHLLSAAGGIPTRTITEDMDWTWTCQEQGWVTAYVPQALVYTVEPHTMKLMARQLNRWSRGFFQNIRFHRLGHLWRTRPMLGFWVTLSFVEILSIPLWYGAGVWLYMRNGLRGLAIWGLWEVALMLPHVLNGARRRGWRVWQALGCLPFAFITRQMNMFFVWKALVQELILRQTLVTYEKGH